MGYTIAQKIIKEHLVSGEMTVGTDVGLKIDQTLTQDATGTMAYIEYEAMGIPFPFRDIPPASSEQINTLLAACEH